MRGDTDVLPPGRESPKPFPRRGEVRDACCFFVNSPKKTKLTKPLYTRAMARPPETFGKVAAVFGVTRQAVHKWKRNGAPFYSAEALLTWLDNREGTRVLDNFRHRCPVLLANLEQALAWPVFWP